MPQLTAIFVMQLLGAKNKISAKKLKISKGLNRQKRDYALLISFWLNTLAFRVKNCKTRHFYNSVIAI